MIIFNKHLPRRTFLQGLGTAIALPFLDAMVPAMNSSATKYPVRMTFVYVPNGIMQPDWKPTGVGKDFQFARIMKSLEPLREDLFILSGLDDHNGNALGDGPGDHGRAGASFLSGVHAKKTAGADIAGGISVDQFAAREIGSKTRLQSLELGCEDANTVGNCDSGYSCAYTNSISWRTPSTPMPPEVNPRLVFERLFGTADYSLDPETRARRMRYRKSILDMSRERTQDLNKKLGPNDRRKLDEYLFTVRDIEQRIERAEKENRDIQPTIEKPGGVPVDFRDYVKLMYDLQLVAFQTDLTRVTTLMVREGSNRVYPEIDIADPHHPLTHHRNNAEWIEKVTKINTLHVELLGYFLNNLKKTREGDGSLLDHSMVMYGSGLSDGNKHLHEDLPILLAGRGDGSLKPGRHIVHKQGTPITNLYMTMLARMGVEPEKIGDSNGKLNTLDTL